VFIYHFGDHDPSGQDAGRVLEQELRLHAPEADISFRRVAVTSEQVRDWKLPNRPTKLSDPRAKKFGSDWSCELEAINPQQLRDLVRQTIEHHLPRQVLDEVNQTAAIDMQRLGRVIDDYIIESNRPRDYEIGP
jgi:hypothetical protein